MASYVDGKLEPLETIRKDAGATEEHIHTHEHWLGASATEESLSAYTVDSGAGAFGTEVVLLEAGDTPITALQTKWDAHRILFATLQHATPYVVQLVWGTGTFAAGLAAGQHSEIMVIKSTATGASQGVPADVKMPQLDAGTALWVRIKNATDTSTVTLFIGIHEYLE